MTVKPSPTSSVTMLCPDVNVLLYAFRSDSTDHSRYAQWPQLTTPLRPGTKHGEIFSWLCRATSATANNVPYAYHAALAIAHGATWITNDLGNAQFPNLLWRNSIEN